MSNSAPKRIVLASYGSRGDVQPFLALSQRLLQRGHRVCLLAPLMSGSAPLSEFRHVFGERFEFIRLEGDIDTLAQAMAQSGMNPLRTAQTLAKFVLPLAVNVYRRLIAACCDADLLVHTFAITDGAHQVARDLGIPDISAQFFPIFAPTSHYPAIGMPDLRLPFGLSAAYLRWTHRAMAAAFRHGGRLMYAGLRRKHPDLPALGEWLFDHPLEERPPLVFAFSPQVAPPDPAWPANIHTTGYWFMDEPDGWQPPEELLRFLETGDPPVYIGFGSMTPTRDAATLELVLQALRELGELRAVVALPGANGVAGSPPAGLPLNVLAIESAPHSWLFPRMAALVHHGGSGTTAAGLRAGVPMVITPFMGDQGFWAQRIVELGVGPPAAPLKRLTSERLAQALHSALDDEGMRARAQALGERLRAEDGLGEMVDLIETVQLPLVIAPARS